MKLPIDVGLRTGAAMAVAAVLFAGGAASGAVGSAMLIGRSNDAGTKATTLRTESPGGAFRVIQRGSGPALVAKGGPALVANGPTGGVGIELRSGALRVEGAGRNTSTAAFILDTSSMSSCVAGSDELWRIDHPHANGRPGAILLVTQRSGTILPYKVRYLSTDIGSCGGGYWHLATGGPRDWNVLVMQP